MHTSFENNLMQSLVSIIKLVPLVLLTNCLLACASHSQSSAKNEFVTSHFHGSSTSLRIPISISYQEIAEKNIFMQREDYSCGAASLATILKYYFEEDVNEKEILNTVERNRSVFDIEVIRKDGLSIKELGAIAATYGYESAPVRLVPQSLEELQAPVIVFLEREHYRHFAVLKSVKTGHAHLADPSRGNIRVPMSEFLESWDGITLFLGKNGFVADQIHGLSVTNPDSVNMASDTAAVGLLRTMPKTFSVKATPRSLR